MFSLHLLGGLRLDTSAGDLAGRGVQRLRLAVLAVLALSPGRRLTRDRLTALIWPEATADEARQRLSSALYDTRRLLGDEAIHGRGDELTLDPGLVQVDVDGFLGALAAEQWEEAERWYAGPLLDGVHLAGSAEFESWVAGHRDRLHRAYLALVERLARRDMEAGAWAEAAERWESLTAQDPFAARWTVELMQTRIALHDRAGALRVGEAFDARLKAELGLPPDPAVSALLAELRRPVGPPSDDLVTGASVPHPPAGPVTLSSAPPTAPPGRLPDRGVVPPSPQPSRRRHLAATMVVFLALVGGWLYAARQVSRTVPAETPIRVAVLPFAVTGDSGFHFLGDGLVDLLSADLEGVGPFIAIDPHAVLARRKALDAGRPGAEVARSLDAARYVQGRVFGVGDSLGIQAALHDAATGTLLHEARVVGPLEAVPRLVDQLTAQLAAGTLQGGGQRIASVGAMTTLSIPALRAFLAGESSFRRGRFGDAVVAYQRAVALDTSFALAHYRLSLAILWGNAPGAETALHDSLAVLHGARLSPRDRDLVMAYTAWRRGEAAGALDRYLALTRLYPDDVEAWFQLGETEFHYGARLGRAIADSRVSFERVLALDPSHWGARWHLALLDGHEGRHAQLRTRAIELLGAGPDPASALEVQLTTGVAPPGAPAARPSAAEGLDLFEAGWRRAVYLRDLEGAERLFSALLQPGRSPYEQNLGRGNLGLLALARGQLEQARAILGRPRAAGIFELEMMATILPGFERPTAARESLLVQVTEWGEAMGALLDPYPSELAAARRVGGLLAASLGDTALALAAAQRLESTSGPPELVPLARSWAHSIRAFLAYGAGNPTAALEELTRGTPAVWYGLAVTAPAKSGSLERFLRAEALRDLGRPEEALSWYRGFDEHAVHDLIFLAPALLRSAELNERLGRGHLAAEQLGRAAALWRDADPPLRAHLARQWAAPNRGGTSRLSPRMKGH